MNIAINGFGRIGKQFFLASMEQNVNWKFIINDVTPLDNLVYSLKYDSVHPSPNVNISHDGKNLIFGKLKIPVYQELDPLKLPWKKENIDLVVESSGFFTNREDAQKHIKAGAKRVLISAPAKNHDCTIVFGVNSQVLKNKDIIVSAGSCTTNCIAPIVKILNDNYKIEEAHFVTTHAYTSTQKLIDSHDKKDMRRGRSAPHNIIPSTSGASQSVVESIPELKGKLEGYALRVPVIDGSISSIFARVSRKATKEEINSLFKKCSLKEYKDILQYTEEQIVSSDIIHNKYSCIFDATITNVTGNLISVAGWYDNEWGYSNRLVDVVKLMIQK